jgi:Predicted membrane protein (DUF2142)
MVGLTLILVAWIAGTVPFTAPDEASHYIRALSIANGKILGPKIRYTDFPLSPEQEAWANRDTRGVTVPARLTPPNIRCWDHEPNVRGSCLEEDDSGNYPPLSYLLPAVGLSASDRTSTAIWVARAANAVQSLAFLLLAVALLWNGTGWSVLGLLAATTPMVFFSSTVVNPSGLQITACLAFVAALIRIARAPTEVSRWIWVACAVSGAFAILAGPIGLEFVILDLALFGAVLGRGGLKQMLTVGGRPEVRLCTAFLVGAAVVALAYSHIAGLGATTLRISPLAQGIHQGIDQLPPVLQGAVGIFASLTIFLPLAAYWIWWLVVLGLGGMALYLGDRRTKIVWLLVAIVALVFPVLFVAWIDRFTGFGLQGREVLPALLLIPMAAGEVVSLHSSQFGGRRVARVGLGSVIALIAVFQGYAWWYDARSAAGAPHTIRFYAHATWSPPMGWFPWIMSAALGTVALLIFASSEGLAGIMPAVWPVTARRKRVAA